MAPKKGLSKNSRAARRGQENPFESSETKELASIPRLEKTDTITPLIRSSVNKNQQLLNQKMNKSSRTDVKLKPGDNFITDHNNKKKQHMVSKTVRSKQHKFQNIDGRLGKKVENALNRKKRIANLRKTGWEKINELAKNSLDNELIISVDSEKKTTADIEAELAEEMMGDYEEEIQPVVESKNPYDLLGEEED
ncbi:60S ribosomal protein subunit export [Pichia californica]|uniref:60S ribosomal protein subunit export n=1 Tax=Pichia californica TaxID=460514 RepID=A0A9P7BGS0_9ASCO|nr:60S ribosomal protein subunit export [[Candida] californica]KAG0689570.1 60S ribosomal protein subunit export [[Candida] californica]